MLLGTEQEYGIALVGVAPEEAPHPMWLSNAVIRSWVDDVAAPHVGFDFASEQVANDQWGFTTPREELDDSVLTDENPMANRMLTNGARFYVDHAHPEYSGPECTTIRDAVLYDRAGDVIMQRAAERAKETRGADIRLFRNNADGKGQSWGTHENYLLPRAIDFADVVRGFTPYLVTRGIFCGAGRVGIGQSAEHAGYQLTQRADFFEREVGLETTLRRPIINTRDEPHGDPSRHRRLHVIAGDATMCQYSTWLRLGTAALVLDALVAGALPEIVLADPVRALHAVSHDLTLGQALPLADGGSATALDVQERLLQACTAHVERTGALGDEGPELVEEWGATLGQLRADPAELADRVDWIAKLRLLDTYRERDGLAWDDPKLAAIDLQWSEIDPSRGLALKLERAGRLLTMLEDDDVEHALTHAPADTRAWLRGELLRRFGNDVLALGWDTATISTSTGRVRTLRLTDPLAFTASELGVLLGRADRVDEVVAALAP